MAANTSIEWAANADGTPGATWNPVRALYRLDGIDRQPTTHKVGTHCVHASEGCRNCYAEAFNLRGLPGAGTGLAYTKQNEAKVHIFLDEKMLTAPLRRSKPTTYFLSSMTDVFADFVTDAMLDRLFAVMALSPRHTFIVLTKRADRMRTYFTDQPSGPPPKGRSTHYSRLPDGGRLERRVRVSEAVNYYDMLKSQSGNILARDAWAVARDLRQADGGTPWPLPNVCLVVSVEDQANADARIPDLLATPAAVRGVSCEPLLGPIDLTHIRRPIERGAIFREKIDALKGWHYPDPPVRLDWVICGGESGRKARPMHLEWARDLRDQCAAAGVPFFFKQWGEHAIIYDRDVEDPDWRRCDVVARENPNGRWLNLAGGHGFHGDRVVYAAKVGKAKAGRILDGRTHDERPKFHEVAGRKGERGLLATTASPGSPAR